MDHLMLMIKLSLNMIAILEYIIDIDWKGTY